MQKSRKQKATSMLLVVLMISTMFVGVSLPIIHSTSVAAEENEAVELASWTYSPNRNNGEINASLTANNVGGNSYKANDGVYKDVSLFSGRKYTTDERNSNHAMVGSSGYISFGTADPAFREGDYIQFQLSTKGYEDITFGILMRLTGGAPGDFELQYSYTGAESDYHDTGLTLSRRSAATFEETFTFKLPTECEDQETLFVRMIVVGSTSVVGGTITTTGTWGIDNVAFTSGYVGSGNDDDDDDDNGIEIASWRYSPNRVNGEINANLTINGKGNNTYGANSGVYKDVSLFSGRKYTTDERNSNHAMVGSSGYISFGTADPAFREGDYIQFQLSTKGYDDITFLILMRLTGGAPGDFKIIYSYTGAESDYHDTGLTINRRNAMPIEEVFSFELPTVCEDQETLFLRIVVVGSTAIAGVPITTTGTWGIDNALFISGYVEPEPPVDEGVDIASWKYSPNRNNGEINASLTANNVGGNSYKANDGVYKDDSFLSGRKYTTDERNSNHAMVGSSGYLSFGTDNPSFREGDHFQFQLSTLGYGDITLSILMRLTGGAPGDFKLEYSYTGEEDSFRDTGLTLSRRSATTIEETFDFKLPRSCENHETLYIRITVVGSTSVVGNTITTTGTWGIDNVVFNSKKIINTIPGGDMDKIASWKYSPNIVNAEINAWLMSNDMGDFTYHANGGVYAAESFVSARKYTTDQRNTNHSLRGSSGYISFGTETAFVEGDYYQFQLSTRGYEDVNLSILMRITSGGPGDFKLQYSYTGAEDDYHDSGLTLSRRYSGTVEVTDLFVLPEECWDQDILFLRLTIVGNRSQGGGTISTTGTWGINNIVFNSGLDEQFLAQYLSVEVITPQELLDKGDKVDVQVKVKNISSFDIADVNVHMDAPYFAVPFSGKADTLINIKAGETVTLYYSYIVIEGGREAFYATVERSGAKLLGFDGISVSGSGYFRGDNHSHSLYSDGSGTIADNVNEAYYNKMLSWLYSTDHNTLAQTSDTLTQTVRMNGSFLNIAGNEFTAYNGHALFLGIDVNPITEVVPYNLSIGIDEADKLTGKDYGNLQKWQDMVNFVTGLGGSFYMAHPYSTTLGFDYRPLVMSDNTIRDIRGFTGMEIWNGSYTSAGNVQSRETWDKVNTQGTGHYNGIATSDAHAAANIGVEYIKAFLPGLTVGNVNDILVSGKYFGSNGPEVRFDIDGVGISETLNITGSSKTADFNIHVYSPVYDLTKVEIIKNTITGNFESNKQVVYSYTFAGESTNVFDKVIQLEVKPGEFYRVEVESKCAITTMTSLGFAITNNIWIDSASKSNAVNLSDVQYVGSGIELKTLPTGIMYLDSSNDAVLNLNDLSASVSSGATLGKAYDPSAGIVTLTVTAEDGTVSSTEIFMVNATPELSFEAETLTLTPGSTERDVNFTWYSDRADNTASVVQMTATSSLVNGEFPATGVITLTGTVGDASAGKSWHKASATGLEYDTEYSYRVSNDGVNFSETYTYKTVASGSFQFIAVGDPQLTTGNQDSNSLGTIVTTKEGWQNTIDLIKQYFPNASFMAGTGDQVDTATSEEQYTNYFAPDYLRVLPIAPAVGNHEGTAPNFGYHYNVPNENANAAADHYGNYWYVYNNALFVVLNTAPYPSTPAQVDAYIATMEATLAAATAANPDVTWIFVQHHKSTTSPASHQTDADVLLWAPEFNKLMDRYNVDFVLAGHDHVYSRSWFILDNEKVEGIDYTLNEVTNPEGTLYFTFTTASGLKYYDFLINAPAAPAWVADNSGLYYDGKNSIGTPNGKPWYTNVGIQIKVPQFTSVDVTENSVTFKTYRTDTMAVIDEYTVYKTDVAGPNTYTVTFKDWDGTILKTQTVEEGSNATAPANPSRAGYTFAGWDRTFSNVTGDLTVNARYTQNGTGTNDTRSISLDKTGTQNLSAIYGYSSASPLNVTVTNTGTVATGVLSVSLSGAGASNFTLSVSSVDSLSVGGTSTFTVTPKTGLAAGTYTATVTVSGSNNLASKVLIVSFTVDKKSITFTGTVTASKQYDGNGDFGNSQIVIHNAGSFSGLVAGDSVTLDKSGVTGRLASGARDGNLTLSGTFTLTGAAANNYMLSAQPPVSATVNGGTDDGGSDDTVLYIVMIGIAIVALAIIGFMLLRPKH
ncbi:MAG: CehA/McbA family metallohydrolase [Methanomassiliicoccaceae archaeon]|nr:CehA/McbA family metallohydrolase [Methanomassiliicoccaceae archaeon]